MSRNGQSVSDADAIGRRVLAHWNGLDRGWKACLFALVLVVIVQQGIAIPW